MRLKFYSLIILILAINIVGLCSCAEEPANLYYSIDDTDYLEVSDLNSLPIDNENYDKTVKQITYLSGMILKTAYDTNGELPSELEPYISEDVFKALNHTRRNDLMQRSDVYEYYDIYIYDVKHNFNKAVVDWGYEYQVCEYITNQSLSGARIESYYPAKIYLEYNGDTWIIVDSFEAA